MNYNILYYSDLTQQQWDNYVIQVPEASYLHSWSWLNYLTKFTAVQQHLSCIFVDHKNNPVAIIPLAISQVEQYSELSFAGTPVGTPALNNIKPSHRRTKLDEIFSLIDEQIAKYQLQKISMQQHPLTIAKCANDPLADHNTFALMQYHLFPHINNTSIIDLQLDLETLTTNISKFHRKNIRKALKADLNIKVYNPTNNAAAIKDHMQLAQQMHLQAAGRATRPQATWDAMYTAILNNNASLFVAFIDATPVSFLFCGEFATMAFGWSQANVKEYEEQLPTRHALEWEAVLYYKKHNFHYYEIGERFYHDQPLYQPSEKEINISIFKERYGGFMLPKIMWYGYPEQNLLQQEISNKYNQFLSQYKFLPVEK